MTMEPAIENVSIDEALWISAASELMLDLYKRAMKEGAQAIGNDDYVRAVRWHRQGSHALQLRHRMLEGLRQIGAAWRKRKREEAAA